MRRHAASKYRARQSEVQGDRERSSSNRQTSNQQIGQVGFGHLPLRSFDVVFDPFAGDDAARCVDDAVRGSGVVISRLADAAGIDDQARTPKIGGLTVGHPFDLSGLRAGVEAKNKRQM